MNIVEAFASNTILGIAELIHSLFWIYSWILIISILLTWVRPDPYHPVVVFLTRATEPVLGWFRRKMPFLVMGGFDLSPIVVFLLLKMLDGIIYGTLLAAARGVN